MAETPNKPEQKAPPPEEVEQPTTEDAGVSTPQAMRELAEDLPTNDKVQQAYKDAMLAKSPQEEAKAKAIVVDESPNASETPSGAALAKVAGISDDEERGEKYLREKTAVRWGYVPVDKP